jgi:catecholate siderophore receptor
MQRDITQGDWDSDWNMDTISLYLMDTVDVSDSVTVFGGVRYDHYDYDLKTQRSGVVTPYDYSDGDWNGHVGVSYALTNNAKVYASFSSATNLNGGESDVGTSGGYGGYIDAGDADAEPEKTDSWELGTKWKLNDGKLLASASLFQITKDDVMEAVRGNDYSATGTANTGKNRVQGIELGLTGFVTQQLSVSAGLTSMKSEILESNNEDNIGKTLANFADNSASLHVKYQATPKFAFGGTATYEDERFVGQPDSAANEDRGIPAYTVFDAFASYQFDRDAKVRLNIGNVFDKDYYLAAYRSGAFNYIGDRRNARVTLDVNL